MDLSSKGKPMSVPMSANFPESSMGAISKGLSSSNISNSINSGSNITNLNTSSNLPQANLFNRPDTHVGGLQEGSDNILNAKKNASANNNNSNNNASNVNSSDNSKDNTINNSNKDNNSVIKNNSNGVRYKECLKNHAANMGGYAVDGCGEFMPSGDEGSLEALKCAACGCHRNFHRREINGGISTAANTNMSLLALPSPISATNTSTSANNEYGEGDHPHNVGGGVAGTSGGFGPGHYNIASPVGAHHHHGMPGFLPHLHHHHHHQYMHSLMGSKLMPGAHGGPATMQLGGHHGAAGGHIPYSLHASGGKRFRTKFTMEQREKMYEFSEKVGWRIQKQDEAAVQQFCTDAGVKRHVLKVWMHNNKNTFGKKLLRFPEAFNALPESSG